MISQKVDCQFVKSCDWVSQIAEYIAALCLLIMLVLMLAEITARNFIHTSIPFTWDYSAYLMGAAMFLGAGSALKHNVHVRVTLLSETIPERYHRKLEAAANFVAFGISAWITYALIDQSMHSFARGAKSFSVVETPLWIPQGVLAIGAIILSLQLCARFIRLLAGEDLRADTGDHI